MNIAVSIIAVILVVTYVGAIIGACVWSWIVTGKSGTKW
jgi:NADH:ubiquinone oxidoreductase subunit 6 (subunit J)